MAERQDATGTAAAARGTPVPTMSCAIAPTSAVVRVRHHRSRAHATGVSLIERHDDSGRRSVALERRQMDDSARARRCDAFDPRPCPRTSTRAWSVMAVCSDCDADAPPGSPRLQADEWSAAIPADSCMRLGERQFQYREDPTSMRPSGINQKIDWSDHISIQSVGTGVQARRGGVQSIP